jgi:hypothetical protein
MDEDLTPLRAALIAISIPAAVGLIAWVVFA